jgi:hypothetical protein
MGSVWLSGSPMFMLGLVALTAIVVFLPKVTKAVASLVALLWF